jgi:hypothetical protein
MILHLTRSYRYFGKILSIFVCVQTGRCEKTGPVNGNLDFSHDLEPLDDVMKNDDFTRAEKND